MTCYLSVAYPLWTEGKKFGNLALDDVTTRQLGAYRVKSVTENIAQAYKMRGRDRFTFKANFGERSAAD